MIKRVLSEMIFLRKKVLSRNNFHEMVKRARISRVGAQAGHTSMKLRLKKPMYVTSIRRLTLKGSQKILKINGQLDWD